MQIEKLTESEEIVIKEENYNREQLRRIYNFLYSGKKVEMQNDLESF